MGGREGVRVAAIGVFSLLERDWAPTCIAVAQCWQRKYTWRASKRLNNDLKRNIAVAIQLLWAMFF